MSGMFFFGTQCTIHTTYTEKFREWHLAQQRIECWSKNSFFRTTMTCSQLLIVNNRTLKLDYTDVIFVNHRVQIDETCLNYLTTVAVCNKLSGSP